MYLLRSEGLQFKIAHNVEMVMWLTQGHSNPANGLAFHTNDGKVLTTVYEVADYITAHGLRQM